MLYREIIAVCSEIHTSTLCGQNVELLNVKSGGTYSNHWTVKSCSRLPYAPLTVALRRPAVNSVNCLVFVMQKPVHSEEELLYRL
jgi:hypothetical protein